MFFQKRECWTRHLKTRILVSALPRLYFLSFSVLICELGIYLVYLSI